MRYWFRRALIVLACGLLFSGVARTDENNSEVSDNTSVSDGPSRGEIFELRLRAELGPMGALSAAAAPPFFLPSDVNGDSILGIDVSHHNDENCKCKPGQDCSDCKIDWNRIRDQKVSFVYVKASQGTKYRDPTFDFHWRTLAQNKIPRGAYHFMSADEDPVVQADNFVGKMEQDGKLQTVDLPPCLDLESDMRKDSSKRWLVTPDSGEIRDFWIGQDPDEIVQKVLKWLKRVEDKTGRIPIIYTSRGWWSDRIKDEKKFAQLSRYPIWIANYPASGSPLKAQPKVPNGQAWALWQFTETGRMKDSEVLPGKMDINLFNGTLGDFNQALGVTVPEKKEVAVLDPPKETTNPSEPVIGTNPNDSQNASKPSEQAVDAKPSEPTDASKPSEPVVVTKPTEPTDTSKPSEPVVISKPTEPTDASKPSEPVVITKPTEPTDASKPSEPVVVTKPTEPADTSKPSEPVVAMRPSEPTDANKPTESQTVTVPTDAKQDTAPNNPPSSSRSRPRSRTAQNSASQNAAPPNTTTQVASAQKMTVEIVLVNGRVLRVDANIDPAILTRLITAVEAD